MNPWPYGQSPSSDELKQSEVKTRYSARCCAAMVKVALTVDGAPEGSPWITMEALVVFPDVAPGVEGVTLPDQRIRSEEPPEVPVAMMSSSRPRALPIGSVESAPPPIRYALS